MELLFHMLLSAIVVMGDIVNDDITHHHGYSDDGESVYVTTVTVKQVAMTTRMASVAASLSHPF